MTVTSCKLNCHDLFSLSFSITSSCLLISVADCGVRNIVRAFFLWAFFSLNCLRAIGDAFDGFRIDFGVVSCICLSIWFLTLAHTMRLTSHSVSVDETLLQSLSRHRRSYAFLHLFTLYAPFAIIYIVERIKRDRRLWCGFDAFCLLW